jgi:hypothetical protein
VDEVANVLVTDVDGVDELFNDEVRFSPKLNVLLVLGLLSSWRVTDVYCRSIGVGSSLLVVVDVVLDVSSFRTIVVEGTCARGLDETFSATFLI